MSYIIPGKNRIGIEKPVVHSLVIRSAGLALIFLSQVLLARLMGVRGYGEYTVIITALNFAVVLSLFGMDTSVLRFLPAYIQRKDFGAAHGFLKFSYRVISALAILGSIGIFIYLLDNSRKFHIGFSEAVFWSVLLLPFLVFVNQASSVLRAMSRIKTSLLPAYFLLPLGMCAGWWYYFRDHNKLPVDAAMMINLLVTILVFIFIYRKVNKVSSGALPAAPATVSPRLWLSVSATVLLSSMLNLLIKQSDILFVGYLMNHSAAGTYSAAAKMSALVALGLSVVDYVYIPKIAAQWEAKKLIGLQRMVREASRQILIISLPVAIVMILGGKWLLGLFGPAFVKSYVPLVILVAGQVINSITGMVGGVLMMTGHQRIFFMIYLLAFVLQAVLILFLIPAFGISGAAVASSSAVIFLNLAGYYYIKRKIKIKASAL